MKRLPSERWLAAGGALATVGAALVGGYWVYVMQATPRGGFWQLPGYLGVGVLALGLLLLCVGFFAPVPGTGSRGRRLEEQQQLRRRQRFAKDVRRKLQLLEGQEWSDERFTELEAQVIVERTGRSRFTILNLGRSGRTLEYRRSLTKALRTAKDEMILLQGDPGCGKSVALRHVALAMAEDAAKSRRPDAAIPIYVNLKGLRRGERPIDAALIQDYVDKTLRDDVNADVERFLDEEFERGLTEGTWFFLFDSFDEMPEILSSTRVDDPIRDYSQAIATFLSGMRPCRGVVASREFRSPKGLPWPKWQIRPLTGERQRTLVRRYLLDREKEEVLLAGLDTADHDIVHDATNPLFISLLADYVLESGTFPHNSHEVYEGYVARRLQTDAARIAERFDARPAAIRATAEQLAFCMADDGGLGLEPSRREALEALERHGPVHESLVMTGMDVLEYLKLAKGHPDGPDPRKRVFTFAHRRFQEYFSTSAVLDGIGDVSPDTLLRDPRWRETAVTLCQLQRDSTEPLLGRSREILRAGALASASSEESSANATSVDDDLWPASTLEVLEILQSGFGSDPERLPDDVRDPAGELLQHVYARGLIYDRATAVSVAGVAQPEVWGAMVRTAFDSGSQLLADEAYLQISRLRSLPADLVAEIRRALLRMVADGTLRKERMTVRAQLRRFEAPGALLRTQRLALLVFPLDTLALVAFLVALVMTSHSQQIELFTVAATCAVALAHTSLSGVAAELGGTSGFGLRTEGGAMWCLGSRGLLLLLAIVAGEPLPALVASCALLTWMPAALFSIRQGRFLHPAACPLIALYPVVAAARQLRSLEVHTIIRDTNQILGAVGFIAAFVLISVGFVVLPSLCKEIVLGLGVLLTLLPTLSDLPDGLLKARRYARDALWYRRWYRQPASKLEPPELMKILAEVREPKTAARVLVDLRSRDQLRPTPETHMFLADLGRAVGAARPPSGHVWRTQNFEQWREATTFLDEAAWHREPVLEDEIARSIKALRERSRDSRRESAQAMA